MHLNQKERSFLVVIIALPGVAVMITLGKLLVEVAHLVSYTALSVINCAGHLCRTKAL
jgi:hypothetical protein